MLLGLNFAEPTPLPTDCWSPFTISFTYDELSFRTILDLVRPVSYYSMRRTTGSRWLFGFRAVLKLREMLPKVLGAPARLMTTVTIDYFMANCMVSQLSTQVEIIDSFSLKTISSSWPVTSGLTLVDILFWPLRHTTSMKAG